MLLKSALTLTTRQLTYRLHRARKDPSSVLEDPCCRTPEFCLPFFDVCDATAYEELSRALEFSSAAVELARRTGNRHLVNRSRGVEINAANALGNREWLASLLSFYEAQAADCLNLHQT